MASFYRVLKHLREHGKDVPVPQELVADLMEIKARCERQQRLGINVHLSPYMLSLLGLKEKSK